jgi:UDP-N-acetylmuramoyl-L-alanyl-D-glutamate--2,6-diaminopimelate ligase
MVEGVPCNVKTYALNNDADFKADNAELFSDRVQYDLSGEKVVFGIPGDFSVYNSLCAIGAVCSLGFDLSDVISAISKANSVKGRLELLKTNTPYGVIIDYAHSPDGLEKAINAVRGFTKGRVITLFGCGGDRDKTKRPKMGKIAAELSDIVVVTSDNPRTEDPEEIIKDILEGIDAQNKEIITITDRSEAIKKAISIAEKDDAILLAGKGHETYQVIGKERVHYDEREIVSKILE